jgi:hypothetical protein
MTALLAILERQADALGESDADPLADPITDSVGAPFDETELLAELDEQAAACSALALVAIDRHIADTPFQLSQRVLETLSLHEGPGVDHARSAMVEDAVVVHGGGGSPARLRRSSDWPVLFGTMAAITGLAQLLAVESGKRASTYVRLAFDAPDGPTPPRPSRSAGRATSHPAGTAMPVRALGQVEQWAVQRPSRHDPDVVDPHDVRLEVRKRGKALTVVERYRVPFPEPGEPEWAEVRIAQFRWVPGADGFSLHYADRSDRWHRCNLIGTADLETLLALVDADADDVFWT